MKYLTVNDIYTFFKKYYFYLIGYVGIIFIYIFVKKMLNYSFDLDLLLVTLGFHYSANMSVLDITMFILNISFNFFIIFQIFDNDIKNGICNIFLRINKIKWLHLKLLSCIIILMIKVFLSFGICLIFIGNPNIQFLKFIYYFYIGCLFNICINFFIIISLLFPKNIRNCILILFFFLIIFSVVPYNFFVIIKHKIFIYIILFIQLLVMFLRRNYIYILLEEGDLK